MKSRLQILSCASLLLLASATGHAETKPPNFVVVLADDLGYAALSCNGGTLVQTPNLDRLASEGISFTNCHVQPLCSPTRVALMTGRGNRRNYVSFGKLDPRETTFAHVLQKAGYATAVAGKWQLGSKETGPKHAGFDNCNIRDLVYPGQPKWTRYWGGTVEVDGVEQKLDPDVFAADSQLDWSLRWIDAHKDKPFLLYLPSPLTHATFCTAPGTYTAGKPAPGIDKQTGNKAFPSLLGQLDLEVGVLADYIKKLGLESNTLFIFLGDNGTEMKVPGKDGEVEQPGKGRTNNAGTHVPLIAWWPGTIKPAVAGDLVGEIDLLPTLAELAGVKLPEKPELDGISLAGRLLHGQPSPRTELYHWYSPHGEKPVIWVQDTRWKLYGDGRLFDTLQDRNEQNPVPAGTAESDAARARLQAVIDKNEAIPIPKIERGGKKDDGQQ